VEDGAAEKAMKCICGLALVLLAGCANIGVYTQECCEGDFGGLDLGYSCAKCGMAITDEMLGFSSYLTLKDGTKVDFCTICCLLRYNTTDFSNAHVADYRTLEWVGIKDAYYLKDSDIKTPMNCGIIAFKDHRSVSTFREIHEGVVLRFEDLREGRRGKKTL
jgi:hypothetical protein